jgi:hypothetical protein
VQISDQKVWVMGFAETQAIGAIFGIAYPMEALIQLNGL